MFGPHGHVNARPDGVLARCGGPGFCRECALELAERDHILPLLLELYDRPVAAEWMRTPQKLLGGKTAVQVLAEPGGRERIIGSLRALLDGAYS